MHSFLSCWKHLSEFVPLSKNSMYRTTYPPACLQHPYPVQFLLSLYCRQNPRRKAWSIYHMSDVNVYLSWQKRGGASNHWSHCLQSAGSHKKLTGHCSEQWTCFNWTSLLPSVYLVRHWYHSHDKCSKPFLLCSTYKWSKWTVGSHGESVPGFPCKKAGNEASSVSNDGSFPGLWSQLTRWKAW